MTAAERQAAAARVLLNLERPDAHDERCPRVRGDTGLVCSCHLGRNSNARAAALDEAGLLCALVEIQPEATQ